MGLEISSLQEVKIKLPNDLLKEVTSQGLLETETLTDLLKNELNRRQRIDQLFDATDKLVNIDLPILTPEEVEKEIQATRKR
jgi:hypothetical protein